MKNLNSLKLPTPLMLGLLLTCAANLSFSQSTAEIAGTITDTSGAVIPGAKIIVTNQSTEIKAETVTNDSGNYSVLFLNPGAYRVDAQKESFRSMSRPGIQLQVGQAVNVDFKLELGAVTQSVDVSSNAVLLDTSTNIGGIVGAESIANEPMKGRNASAFMELEPGVVMPRAAANQPVLESHYQFFSISGGRPEQNQFLLDGSNDTDSAFNGPQYTPSVDSVQEYKVQTNTYSAEYGNYQGGVINSVTKSGTNQIHGSLYEYVRNNVFEATAFFINATGAPKPELKMNQFGGTIGGPIKKNKTFFFGSYEGLELRVPSGGATASTNLPSVTSVPTALQKAGNFSQTFASNGALQVIYNPASVAANPNSPGTYTRAPFPNNVIPASMINPVSAAMQQYFPAPNSPGTTPTGLNNFQISSSEGERDANASLKIDHHINDSTSIMGRYSEELVLITVPNVFGTIADPFNSITPEHHSSGVITLNRIFTPTLIGEFVGSWNRATKNVNSADDGFNPTTKLGMPSYITSGAPFITFPLTSITSMSSLGDGEKDHYTTNRPEFRVNVTKVKGSHTIKFGGLIGAAQLDGIKLNDYTGSYGFTQGFTQGPNPLTSSTTGGFGYATFLLGYPATGTYNPNLQNAANTAKYTGLYAQDEYKVTSRLTMTLGLRWDDEFPEEERYNRIPNFDFTDTATLSNGVGVRGGLEFPGVKGLPRGAWSTNNHNFGPRAGIAYNVTPKTVIRAGGGIFYGNSFGSGRNGNQVPETGFACSTSIVGTTNGGVSPSTTISDPFPTGFCNPSGSSLGLLTGLGQSVLVIGRNHQVPSTESWNFNVQRELPLSFLLEASYTGNRGLHLPSNVSADQLSPSYLGLGNQLNSAVPNPYYGLISTGTLSTPTITLAQSLLPYPQYLNVTSVTDTYGASTYNAAFLKVSRRLAAGFGIVGSYTFSKVIDDVVSSPTGFAGESFATGTPQNYYNLHADRSIASFNTPQSLVVSLVYEFPFGPGKRFLTDNGLAGKIVGGWQLNMISTFRSGEPLMITGGNTSALNAGTQRPNWNGQNPTLSGSVTSRLNEYFNTADFALNPIYTFGNAPRIMPDLYGPGTDDWDFSVFKNTQIRERYSLQFRAEAFNAFNRVQFGNPATTITTGTFGVISSQANLPRDVQFALKLLF